jgi:hypothetical protein
MNEISKFHDEAMNLAELAAVAKVKGDSHQADELLRKAYGNEVRAAHLMTEVSSPEPTRSVLFRSAASLAIDCNELREAEKLIAIGLSGNPPSDIAEELRDLFERVNFQRHLDLHGVVLEDDELQMSIAGRSVSVGIAPSDQLVGRIEHARRLMFRTIERLLHRPYREVGAMAGTLREYGLFLSTPRAASFAVTLRVSHPKPPLPGFEKEAQFIYSSQIIDEIMSCLETFSKSEEKELREKIPDDAYFRNFVGIAKNLAPDGSEIRQVGFTALRRGRERRLSLTVPRDQIRLAPERIEGLKAKAEGEIVTVTGKLLLADARRSGREKIQLIDDRGQAHTVIVPEGMMSDIVKPLWEERVRVTGYYKWRWREIRLEDISKAPTD